MIQKLSSGTAYEISSSTNVNDPVSFISSSGFKVSAGGQVTASALQLSGGDVGGLAVSSGQVAVGEVLKFKDSGQITGSNVLFTGGKIAAFDITDNVLSNNPNFFISGSATGNELFISASNFNIKASGDITGSSVLLDGGTIGGFTIDTDEIKSANVIIDSTNEKNCFRFFQSYIISRWWY